MNYFSKSEMECPCCGLNKVDDNPDFLNALNHARELYGKPMNAESMTRCEKHNKEIGGAPKSAHLDGRAVDIECDSMVERAEMLWALYEVGFRRFEIKEHNLHADMKLNAPQIVAIKTNHGII